LRQVRGVAARALEFTLLTVARTGAVVGAEQEIDFENLVWTVPPERVGTKIDGDRPRRIPLTEEAARILRSLHRRPGNPHLFQAAEGKGGLCNNAMLKLMQRLRPGYVPHGLRSTFKDWCSETTNYPNEVSEAALWHVVADRVEAAYRRGDLFDKRRALMNDWAAYCGGRS
jgi:integrase